MMFLINSNKFKLMKKIIIFLFFTNLKLDIIGENTKKEGCGVTNMVFYVLGNKGLLPNVNYTKSYKYCDFYFGASNGLDVYFINNDKIKLGLFSFRHETLNMFFNALVCKFDKNIHFALGIIDPLAAFVLGFYVSGINIKFGPISLNFIEFPIFAPLCPIGDWAPYKKDYNGNEVIDENLKKNLGINQNVYFWMTLFVPSVKIDICQLIYNIKNKKSFFNLSRS